MPFEGVLGQSRPRNILKNALLNNKVAHAYLFFGETSVGRKPMALELAKTLNCTASIQGDNCGICLSCNKIDSGIHPDIYILEPETSTSSTRLGTIKIEALRELQKKLAYLPYEGKCKVAIIDSAETMNSQASNSFLKILEEPPPNTLFILIASNPHQLLPTLVSRCQAIRFMPLSPSDTRRILIRNRDKGEFEANDDEIEIRAMRAGGRIDQAMDPSLLEICERREELIELIAGAHLSRMDVFIRWSKSVAKQSVDVQALLSEMARLLRDITLLRSCGRSATITNADLRPQLISLAEKKKLNSLVKMFKATLVAQKDLDANYNAQLSLENLWIEFCAA
ncbi:MAG: DNA polymerase III subunit delta' [Nitrospinae bacterium CG11_big_fil_rev_8_21_14_0_20_45_15]|nr:MAG: DNA polymerase III subunit delta' [Nitrospinae bacterium CG11_big_fil_rev_8_21_14_0_20_45_15]